MTGFIDEARRHEIRADVLNSAEHHIHTALERGRAGGEWYLDAPAADLLAALLGLHDEQLRTASLSLIAGAIDRLERLRDGQS